MRSEEYILKAKLERRAKDEKERAHEAAVKKQNEGKIGNINEAIESGELEKAVNLLYENANSLSSYNEETFSELIEQLLGKLRKYNDKNDAVVKKLADVFKKIANADQNRADDLLSLFSGKEPLLMHYVEQNKGEANEGEVNEGEVTNVLNQKTSYVPQYTSLRTMFNEMCAEMALNPEADLGTIINIGNKLIQSAKDSGNEQLQEATRNIIKKALKQINEEDPRRQEIINGIFPKSDSSKRTCHALNNSGKSTQLAP